jgi:hypothetical protein
MYILQSFSPKYDALTLLKPKQISPQMKIADFLFYRRVVWRQTEASGEHIASIFEVERQTKKWISNVGG